MVILCMSISSCTSFGEDKYSASYIKANVIENKTTKAEIQSIYGVPDEQSTSGNSTVWYYRKGSGYNTLSTFASYVPGGSSISGAIEAVKGTEKQADTLTKASNKVLGDSEHRSDYLSIDFNEKGIVTSWHLY